MYLNNNKMVRQSILKSILYFYHNIEIISFKIRHKVSNQFQPKSRHFSQEDLSVA